MTVSRATLVRPARAVRGALRVPPDKSISHRYALFAALADGPTTIAGYSTGADCQSTLGVLEALGVMVTRTHRHGTGGADRGPARRLRPAVGPTRLRQLRHDDAARVGPAGVAAVSLRARGRRLALLTPDAARDDAARGDGRAVGGRRRRAAAARDHRRGPLHGITHTPEVPSAQIKSAVLLAGLRASGTTTVREPAPTRDHTERGLSAFGVAVTRTAGGDISVEGGARLTGGLALTVPGDPSATAFLAVAAAGLPGSQIDIEDVGLNPTRVALFDVLRRAGADVTTEVTGDWHGEPVGRVGGHRRTPRRGRDAGR